MKKSKSNFYEIVTAIVTILVIGGALIINILIKVL